MKGGPSIEVLIDLALGKDSEIAGQAAKILMEQIFLYEADIDRIREGYKNGNNIAREILTSYSKAEFFTNLPEIEEEIDVVTYVAAEGDISNGSYSRRVIKLIQDQTENYMVNVSYPRMLKEKF